MLLEHASALVSLLGAAQADMDARGAGDAGPVRIGAFQSASASLVPIVLQRFVEARPDVEVQLAETIGDFELVNKVEASELDISFAVLPLHRPGPFETLELFRDPFVLVVSADSPLAELPRLSEPEQLGNLPLVAFRRCRATEWVLARFEERGTPLELILRSDNEDTLLRAAAAGMGAALVPRLSLHGDRRGTRVLELGPGFPDRVISLIWHRDRHLSAAARELIAITREVAVLRHARALDAAGSRL